MIGKQQPAEPGVMLELNQHYRIGERRSQPTYKMRGTSLIKTL